MKFETQPSSKMSLLEKAGMYELYAQNNKLHFNVGNQTLDATKDITALTANSSFIQITAICAGSFTQMEKTLGKYNVQQEN